jgi:hypothetical protein
MRCRRCAHEYTAAESAQAAGKFRPSDIGGMLMFYTNSAFNKGKFFRGRKAPYYGMCPKCKARYAYCPKCDETQLYDLLQGGTELTCDGCGTKFVIA